MIVTYLTKYVIVDSLALLQMPAGIDLVDWLFRTRSRYRLRKARQALAAQISAMSTYPNP